MRQLCLTSDVTAVYIIDNYSDYENIRSISLILLNEETPVLSFKSVELLKIQSETELLINSLLKARRSSKVGNTRVVFLGRTLELDLRDEYDFHLCSLIQFHEMTTNAINLEGSIYVYDRDAFKQFKCDSIIALLRNKVSLTGKNIKSELNSLWRNSQGSSDSSIDDHTLQLGLDKLQKYGLVTFSRNYNEYRLTARGYMYW